MNLIAHHLHTILHTDVIHPREFGFRPDSSTGVMRVAEQEDCRLFIGTFSDEIVPIHLKSISYPPKSRLQHLTTIIADGRKEAVIIGRQDQHFLTRHRECLDGYRHRWHHTSGIENLLSTDGPLMATTEPVDHSHIVIILHDGIAEHPMLGSFADCLQNSRSRLKVHVSHPEGDHVGILTFIPLHAACTSALYQFIEIVLHFLVSITQLLG